MKTIYKMNLIQIAIFIVLECFVKADIIVINGNQTIEEFRDLPAQFGPSLSSTGLAFAPLQALPKFGCETLKPPPKKDYEGLRFVAIISRNNCTFARKVRNAQDAGFDAAIIYNVGSEELERMGADPGVEIKIPSVFVGETTGSYLINDYKFDDGFMLIINGEMPFNINTHLILPFSILVGLCFVIMIAYMLFKYAREQRRLRRHRLPKRLLKKIPTVKFAKGDPYDTCVICLDEYNDGEKIRVLPCGHAYHCNCIDTWLTKNRRVCPICKRKVFGRVNSQSSERQRHSTDSASDSETDDTTPLLNPVENSNNHGTFSNHSQRLDHISNNGQDANNIQIPDEEHDDTSNRNRDNNQQLSQRVNPFDRVPNLPPNLSSNINRRSLWSRLFRRTPNSDTVRTISRRIDPAQQHQENLGSLPVNLPSSNNILNTNLSGSFKDSDGELLLERNSIYEPIDSSTMINIVPSSSTSLPSNTFHHNTNKNNNNNDDSSMFIQTSSSQGGLGVVALPNTNFSTSSAAAPPPSTTTTASGRPSRNINHFFV